MPNIIPADARPALDKWTHAARRHGLPLAGLYLAGVPLPAIQRSLRAGDWVFACLFGAAAVLTGADAPAAVLVAERIAAFPHPGAIGVAVLRDPLETAEDMVLAALAAFVRGARAGGGVVRWHEDMEMDDGSRDVAFREQCQHLATRQEVSARRRPLMIYGIHDPAGAARLGTARVRGWEDGVELGAGIAGEVEPPEGATLCQYTGEQSVGTMVDRLMRELRAGEAPPG